MKLSNHQKVGSTRNRKLVKNSWTNPKNY